jgi:hypothetical protein
MEPCCAFSSPVYGGGAERSEAEGVVQAASVPSYGRNRCSPFRPAAACASSGHLPRKRGRKMDEPNAHLDGPLLRAMTKRDNVVIVFSNAEAM